MRRTCIGFGLLTLVCTSALAQGTLQVPAGQTQIIDPTYLPLLLDELIMEDSSVIRVEGVPEWRVQIARLKIGRNARIDIRGSSGQDASQVRVDNGNTANYCDNGSDWASPSGGAGAPGYTGPDLIILAGIETIGDLTIDRQAGGGGKGGPGGKGEKGGQARCYCSAGGGAKGGSGGDGGPGGRLPKVEIYWYPLGPGSPPSPNAGLRIVGNPGRGGQPGAGGPGGDGGDGACGRGAAGPGWPGDPGVTGRDGANQDWSIIKIPHESLGGISLVLGFNREQ